MLYNICMDIDLIKKNIPIDEEISDLSETFKVFGDPTRAKILYVLEQSELNVTEIALCLNMTNSAISHQLRILRQAKLVKTLKKGKEVYYSLDDEHVSLIFNCALAHVKEKRF